MSRRVLTIAAVLIPSLFIIYCIYIYGVPVPFWDQWEFVPLIEKMHNGTLSLADFWGQHNEHRIIFPKAVMLGLARLTGWDIRYEFAAIFIAACLILLVLYRLLRITLPEGEPLWLIILFSVIVFSPTQWENWLWGWQIQIMMNILGVVTAIWAISRWPGRLKGILIAIAAAVMASYSFSNGLLVWAAALPLLLVQRPRRWLHILLWIISCAVTTGLYMYKYTKPAGHPPLTALFDFPTAFAEYVLLYISTPLGVFNPKAPIYVGAALLIGYTVTTAFIFRLNRNAFLSVMPWLSLALYVFLSACITGVGRVGFGTWQALSSRYVTISMLLTLAFFVNYAKLAGLLSEKGKTFQYRLRNCTIILLVAAGFIYAMTFPVSFAAMRQRKSALSACLVELKKFPQTDDRALLYLYPDIEVIRTRAQKLSELGIIIPKQPVNSHNPENIRQKE